MVTTVADEVPWSEEITPYDEAHLTIYLRLLDAKTDGADVEDMARVILEIDPDEQPERARNAVASHLQRAEWISSTAYGDLLKR